MSRSITVYRKSDLTSIQAPPDDVYSAEFDRWCDDVHALCLYENFLGGENSVYGEWSKPAEKLGLPFLASIHEKGFYEGIEWSGEELFQVERELSHLQQYWSNQYQNNLPLLDQLNERATWLREAIEVARNCDGVLCIT